MKAVHKFEGMWKPGSHPGLVALGDQCQALASLCYVGYGGVSDINR